MAVAQKMWAEMEEKSGEKLLMHTGSLVMGTRGSDKLAKFKRYATADVEYLDGKQM